MDILSLNQNLFFWIFSLSNQSYFLDNLMIFGARDLIYVMILFNLFLILKTKNLKLFILTLTSIIIGFILFKIIEFSIFEQRPYITFLLTPLILDPPINSAFPSRHALVAAFIAFPYLILNLKFKWLFIFCLVWVSLARVFVGVHYPLDVLGGIILGFFSVWISQRLKIIISK